MHRNVVWIAFLALVIVVTLWFGGKATYRLYGYYTLTDTTRTVTTEWTVKEIASDEFIPYATYTFQVGERVVEGEGGVSDAVYRNAWAVREDLPRMSKRSWQVWYNPKNLQHSALERYYPVKDVASAVSLIGLLLYFLWLGYYAERLQRQN